MTAGFGLVRDSYGARAARALSATLSLIALAALPVMRARGGSAGQVV